MKFEIVALPEEFAFLFLLERAAFPFHQMSALLKFECKPAIEGHRLARFDAQRFSFTPSDFDEETDAYIGEPLGDESQDIRDLVEQWGRQLVMLFHPHHEGDPKVQEILLPIPIGQDVLTCSIKPPSWGNAAPPRPISNSPIHL